jgi:ubiquinone/menaquinone biosynthesis C-methylase UbiE
VTKYALGSTDAEHERLIWQAEWIAPLTERLFRAAGIGPGQRVLDIGSGVGDVALLVARLVGPSGEVVGIERDSRSVARARARVSEAGLRNVEFVQCDASNIPESQLFDAAVGRFVLMWLQDPVPVLRSLARLVRPGGVVAFQEPYWAPLVALLAPLPLWSATVCAIHETFRRSGANPELGPALYKVFLEAGLPGPTMRLEMQLGRDSDLAQLLGDLARTLATEHPHLDSCLGKLGDLGTLRRRLQDEVAASDVVAASGAFVGAWARKPAIVA